MKPNPFILARLFVEQSEECGWILIHIREFFHAGV
jgi:hypothetical protein